MGLLGMLLGALGGPLAALSGPSGGPWGGGKNQADLIHLDFYRDLVPLGGPWGCSRGHKIKRHGQATPPSKLNN